MSAKSQFLKILLSRQSTPVTSAGKRQADIAAFRLRMGPLQEQMGDHLESYRINRVNLRKEFFRVELSRIIDEVDRHHGQVEYIADPVALQYLQSLECAENETA